MSTFSYYPLNASQRVNHQHSVGWAKTTDSAAAAWRRQRLPTGFCASLVRMFPHLTRTRSVFPLRRIRIGDVVVHQLNRMGCSLFLRRFISVTIRKMATTLAKMLELFYPLLLPVQVTKKADLSAFWKPPPSSQCELHKVLPP